MNHKFTALLLLFFSFTAHAAPNTFGFNGYFTNSGAPVSNPTASYAISVIALPSGCVLYTESGTVNISNGNFSINVGEGGAQNLFTKSKLSDAFDTTNSSIAGNACSANGTSSTWKMSVTLDGLSMGDVPLNSVPMAMWAERAETAGLSQNFAGSLAGDITGTQSVTTVSKLQGIPLSIAAPTSGHVLTYNGSNWVNQAPSAGDITDVLAGTGLTGGAATGSATLGLAPIAAYSVLANPTGASAAPTATTLSAILDTITSSQGSVLFRGPANWTYLTPGTSGQFLQTQGAGANPIWAAAGGAGDITDVLPGTGLTGGASSGSATLSVNAGLGVNQIPQVGGSAIAANSIILSNAIATALTYLPPGANGDVLTISGGVPIWQTPSGSESTTVSNVGAGGVGLYRDMTGSTINLKNINAASSAITVTNDAGNSEVDINVNAELFGLSTLSANGLVRRTAVGTYSTASLITDADISGSANIAATKIGTGAVDNSEFNYLNGVTSPVQTQIDSKVSKAGDTMTGDLIMSNQMGVVFKELGGPEGIAMRAPSALTADYTLTLPTDDGTPGQVLTSDGGGNLSWTTSGSLGGTGTINAIPKFSTSNILTDSIISESGSNIQIAGNMQVVAGTAAAPAFSFSGDTNTGIYSPSTDTIAISTNGTQRLKINSSGWVSIGASSSGPLDVTGDVFFRNTIYAIGSGGGKLILREPSAPSANTLFGSIHFSTDAVFPAKIEAFSSELHSGAARGTSLRFSTAINGTDTSIERLRIENDGNVGIGTTNPTEKLEVNGNIKIAAGSSVQMGYFRGSCSFSGVLGGTCACPANTKVLGGGCQHSAYVSLVDNFPFSDTEWRCVYDTSSNFDVWVICAGMQ